MKVKMHEGGMEMQDEEKSTVIRVPEGAGCIVDMLGRKIRTRIPEILEEYELMAAIGGNEASNPATSGMARLTLYVAQIDDVPIAVPRTRMQMLAILKQLGNEGIKAVTPAAFRHQSKFGIDEELLKNFSGTTTSQSGSGS
jgi:hypothetical protein